MKENKYVETDYQKVKIMSEQLCFIQVDNLNEMIQRLIISVCIDDWKIRKHPVLMEKLKNALKAHAILDQALFALGEQLDECCKIVDKEIMD